MSQPDPLVGETLADRYQVRRLLGSGRTGRVYLALDPQERRKVAVKVLHPPLCQVDEQVRRFEREFEATSRIDHPNTVAAYAFETDGPHRFLVMELLEGKRLDAVLESSGKLPLRQVLSVTRQILGALAAAHAVGVVHRDLSPANVMLLKGSRRGRDSGSIKVMDFGLARLQGNQEELTGFGVRLGSEHYMSPEYIRSSTLDSRSDLYAVGCLMFHMLTGHPPFIGSSMKVLEGHVNRPAPSAAAEVPNLPGWVEELLLRLLAKDPDDRPQTAEALLAEIDEGVASLEGEPVDEATHSIPAERVAPEVMATGLAHGTRPAPPQPPPARRGSGRWLGLALQIGLALVLLLFGSAALAAAVTWLVLGGT